jgi:hypothetical protein
MQGGLMHSEALVVVVVVVACSLSVTRSIIITVE